jgi:uncharacterized protein YggE
MSETGNFFSCVYNRVLGSIALAALVAALGAYAYYAIKQAQYIYTGPATISVSGEGEVFAIPDIGQFSFAVNATGTDASSAQSVAAERMKNITAYLAEAGVAERDIRTESYNLFPRYRHEPRPCPPGWYCPPVEPITDGFEVKQTVSVKVRALDKAGELIAGVGARGATNLSGLSFTIDDRNVYQAEARALAIAEAKSKAEDLAEKLGVRLKRMVSYYEDDGAHPILPMERAFAVREDAAPPLPPGEEAVKSRVTITYEVR